MKLAHNSIKLVALLSTFSAAALEYDYSLYSNAEYSDNIRQGQFGPGEESGSILETGLDFRVLRRDNPSLSADLSGELGRMWYSSSDLASEDRKTLEGNLLLDPASNNFQVAVLESLRQVSEDRRSLRTVNNRRDVNIFAVVPSYFVDLTSRSRVRVAYAYSRIDEELDISSREVNGATVGYRYRVSNLSDWSLNVSRARIDFTDMGQELDQESAFFRWNYTGVLTEWNLDLGQQRIADVGSTDEPLVALSLSRQMSNSNSVNFRYRRGYNELVNTSVANELTGMMANRSAVYADELSREELARISFDRGHGTTSWQVYLDARTLESEESVSIGRRVDEERYGAGMTYRHRFRDENYNLSPYALAVNYRYIDETFNRFDEQDRIHEVRLRMDYHASRTLQLHGQLRTRDAVGTGRRSDHDENSVLVGIRWSPRGGI